MEKNCLYYGDNLAVLREHIKDESVDLTLKEAAEADLYQPPGTTDKFPRLQILSIAELLQGKRIDYPRYAADAMFKKAPKSRKGAEEQIPLRAGEIEEPF